MEKFREDAGTAALCGRDLPPDAVLRSWAHIDSQARALRKHGAAGTLEQLRAAVYLGLTAGMNPLDMLTRILTSAGQDEASQPANRTGTGTGTGTQPQTGEPWPWDEPDEAENHPGTPAGENPADKDGADENPADEDGEDEDGEDDPDDGTGGTRPDDPDSPAGPARPAGQPAARSPGRWPRSPR